MLYGNWVCLGRHVLVAVLVCWIRRMVRGVLF